MIFLLKINDTFVPNKIILLIETNELFFQTNDSSAMTRWIIFYFKLSPIEDSSQLLQRGSSITGMHVHSDKFCVCRRNQRPLRFPSSEKTPNYFLKKKKQKREKRFSVPQELALPPPTTKFKLAHHQNLDEQKMLNSIGPKNKSIPHQHLGLQRKIFHNFIIFTLSIPLFLS